MSRTQFICIRFKTFGCGYSKVLIIMVRTLYVLMFHNVPCCCRIKCEHAADLPVSALLLHIDRV